MKDSFRRIAAVVSALAAAVAIAAAPLAAQPATQRSVPQTYAITNARIVPVSSPAIERGTIVIRDGLITAVGASVTAPGDARIIDGAGLIVYPGFIDSYTSLGLDEPAAGGGGGRGGRGAAGGAAAAAPRPAVMSTNPPGLQPENSAVDLLKVDADAFTGPQSVGFTSALTAPPTGIYMGQSALIDLGSGDASSLIVKSPVSLNIGFTPLRNGGFPNSLLGVFAALRQSLLDAQHYRDVAAAYARNPRGMKRPDFDPSLDALQPVIKGQVPVVMRADSKREIERALDLAKEFNLKVIIAGGEESPMLAERLKSENVPVLLSVDYPRRAPQAADADPEPLRVLRERVDAPKAAAALQKAGVKFAFESGNISTWADFTTNLQRTVESGLSADDAVKALTWQAADIFGASDRLGSIEAGKIANLTIARGDVFDRGGRISQLFIDGHPVAVRAQTASGAAAATATGNWNVVATLDGADHPISVSLQQDGVRLTGTYQGALGAGEVTNGTIGADGNFRFTASLIVGNLSEECTFSGSLQGNGISGTINVVGEPTTPGKFVGTRPGGGRGGRAPQDGR
ncbi:MAG: amidohydrolase family protein [Gemmatimonadales bacterium]